MANHERTHGTAAFALLFGLGRGAAFWTRRATAGAVATAFECRNSAARSEHWGTFVCTQQQIGATHRCRTRPLAPSASLVGAYTARHTSRPRCRARRDRPFISGLRGHDAVSRPARAAETISPHPSSAALGAARTQLQRAMARDFARPLGCGLCPRHRRALGLATPAGRPSALGVVRACGAFDG